MLPVPFRIRFQHFRFLKTQHNCFVPVEQREAFEKDATAYIRNQNCVGSDSMDVESDNCIQLAEEIKSKGEPADLLNVATP